MGNDLKEYMLKRYEKIAETDEVKKKIALLRKQMLLDSCNSFFISSDGGIIKLKVRILILGFN